MGQCSTLPAEGRGASSVASSRHDGVPFHQRNDPMQEQRHRLREEGRKESLDFNRLVTPEQQMIEQGGHKTGTPHEATDYENTQPGSMPPQHTREAERFPASSSEEVEAMDVDPREEAPCSIPTAPPKNAVKIRAYKLNLDSDILGLSSSQRQQLCLGPFTEPVPFLTYSSSEDSMEEGSATSVAIKTAQIFRGITVSRDGTILSQNARATRSNRGSSKTKHGEKSRQAAKIDKANDLVEEAFASGKSTDTDGANMLSVFVVGEYDDMKQLVRDGSKKLREADGLPDEALLSINRLRVQKQKPVAPKSTTSILLSPRKRASPNYVNSQRTAAMQSPDTIHIAGVPQSAPPRLKSHPRDTRPMRREERSGSRMRFDTSCNDMLDPRGGGGGVGHVGDGDWSHAWNIWNCGGAGTVSPVQTSPMDTRTVQVYEGRDTSHGVIRDAGIDRRAN